MRAGGQRLQRGEVEVDHLVIYGVGVGGEGNVIRFTALRFQERMRRLVTGENRRGSAQFRAHIRDGGALGHAQTLDALAAVLNNLAHAAFHSEDAQYG